jgi:hypothetical protein
MHQRESWRGAWTMRSVVALALLGAMLSLGGCGAMLNAVINGMLDGDDDDGGGMSMSDGCSHHHHHETGH